MAQVLIETGRIDAGDWAETLGTALRRRHDAGAADTNETYYLAVSDALEAAMAVDGRELNSTMAAWRAAYERTPHGRPVEL